MQVKLWLSIRGGTEGAQAEKVAKSGFTITPGMMIEDLAWKDARTVKGVCFSTDTPDTLSVHMGHEDAGSEAAFQQEVEMYRLHGWTVKVYGEPD